MSSLILCGRNCDSVEEVIPFVAKEIGLSGVKPAHLPDLENELLRIDEVGKARRRGVVREGAGRKGMVGQGGDWWEVGIDCWERKVDR